jgi:hypothetical protein
MADLGSNGMMGLLTKRAATPNSPWRLYSALDYRTKGSANYSLAWMLRSVTVGDNYQARGGRDDMEGYLNPPSLRIQSRGKWRFRWKLSIGIHNISVRVKQEINLDPRPTLTVKANSEIGLLADAVGTAPSGAGWVTIGPVSVAITTAGATWVELAANYEAQNINSYWDYLERD